MYKQKQFTRGDIMMLNAQWERSDFLHSKQFRPPFHQYDQLIKYIGLGSLKDLVAIGDPNKSLHW
jgi:hypothetical protein